MEITYREKVNIL